MRRDVDAAAITDGDRHEGKPRMWPATENEAQALLGPHASRLDVKTLGVDIEPILGLVKAVPKIVWKAWARRLGWSLWIAGERAA